MAEGHRHHRLTLIVPTSYYLPESIIYLMETEAGAGRLLERSVQQQQFDKKPFFVCEETNARFRRFFIVNFYYISS